jgi:hypothetical protein
MKPEPQPQRPANKLGQILDQADRAVKDAILDLSIGGRDALVEPPPPPLAAMPREQFLDVMRPRVDELLTQVADVMNQAPSGRIIPLSRERIHRLLEELELDVLERGLKLRIEASYATLPPERRPQGEWARRYRRMRASGAN